MPSQPWQLYHKKLKAEDASPSMLTKMTLTFINIFKNKQRKLSSHCDAEIAAPHSMQNMTWLLRSASLSIYICIYIITLI